MTEQAILYYNFLEFCNKQTELRVENKDVFCNAKCTTCLVQNECNDIASMRIPNEDVNLGMELFIEKHPELLI